MWKDIEDLEDYRISNNYEEADSFWSVDYWSQFEDIYQEDLKYER